MGGASISMGVDVMTIRHMIRQPSFSGRSSCQLILKVCSASSSADPLLQSTGNRGETDVKPFSAIPGPRGLPILGNVRELGANFNKLHLYLYRCFKEYGDIFKLKLLRSK